MTVATALVAATIASAAVITVMIAVTHGGATPKKCSSYWTAITLKESGKVVRLKRVVRAKSDQLAITRSGTARAQIPSQFYAVT